jgi:hypothetical protein
VKEEKTIEKRCSLLIIFVLLLSIAFVFKLPVKADVASIQGRLVATPNIKEQTTDPHWCLTHYWFTPSQMTGEFVAVSNTMGNLGPYDIVYILPLNVAYGTTSNLVWFQFAIEITSSSLTWALWDNSWIDGSDMEYHRTSIGIDYHVGDYYQFSMTASGTDTATFTILDITANQTWSSSYTVPDVTLLQNPIVQAYLVGSGTAFSPASAVEGYTTNPSLTTVQYFQFKIGTGISSYRAYGGWAKPSGISSDVHVGSSGYYYWYMYDGSTVNSYEVSFDQMGVGNDFTGTVVIIDGTNYTVNNLPLSFWWDKDSTHTYAFQSPLVVGSGAKQYDWDSTNGLSTLQLGSTNVAGPGSVTGNYVTHVHDVAVANIAARMWVFQGKAGYINVTVNNGDFPEDVTVTLYYNITDNEIIGTQNITVLVRESGILQFVWNTTIVPYCHNYSLTAVATIPVDSNLADNTLDNVCVKVRILGDVNGDGIVLVDDILTVANAYGSRPGDPRWNPDADISGDGRIRVDDVFAVALNYGKT